MTDRREYYRRYREEHREQRAEYDRHYYAIHREEQDEKARRRRETNREEQSQYHRHYHAAHRQQRAEYSRHWRETYLTPTYQSWQAMLKRCRESGRVNYHLYGGRGISVCARWNPQQGGTFANFVEDMGERPEDRFPSGRLIYSLDRIDNDGNYEPDNCRWATAKEQRANRRA